MMTYSIVDLEKGIKVAFIRDDGKLRQIRMDSDEKLLMAQLDNEFSGLTEKPHKDDEKCIKDHLADKKPAVDIAHLGAFQQSVLNELMKLKRGETASYREIAERIGRPRAARAVGNAVRNNPLPVLIPCHRVIRSDGTPGGFGGKLDASMKRKMLEAEGVFLK